MKACLYPKADAVLSVYACANMVGFGINYEALIGKRTLSVSAVCDLCFQVSAIPIRSCFRCSVSWVVTLTDVCALA